MIRSVDISGLRGVQKGKLDDLAPLSVLVGPNGCGKSTVLDALLIGAHPFPAVALSMAAARRPVRRPGRWLIWRAEPTGRANVTLTTDQAGRAPARRRFYMLPVPPGGDPSSFRVDSESPGRGGLSSIISLEGDVSSQALEPHPVPGVTDVRLVHTTDAAAELHDLYSEALEQGRHQLADHLLSEVVGRPLELRIKTERGAPSLDLSFGDHSVPVGAAGDGVHAVTRLALELASRRGGVVLVEEPEVHLHPRAVRLAARAIVEATRRDIQVVLTTHSLELIDALVAESSAKQVLDSLALFRLALRDGTLISVRVPGPDVAKLRSQIDEDLR